MVRNRYIFENVESKKKYILRSCQLIPYTNDLR